MSQQLLFALAIGYAAGVFSGPVAAFAIAFYFSSRDKRGAVTPSAPPYKQSRIRDGGQTGSAHSLAAPAAPGRFQQRRSLRSHPKPSKSRPASPPS